MTPSVITAEAYQPVTHVRQLMEKNGVSAIPVVSADKQPIGIVTSSDVVTEYDENATVGEIMTRAVYSLSNSDDVSDAASMMRAHEVHHIVILDDGRVVGILSSFDLLKLLASV